jgi:amidohydrolase
MFEDEILQLKDELFSMFQDLHQHPEIGFDERRTASIVARYLEDCGIEVTEGIAITGVTGLLDSGKPGKTLMLRADMDCLEIQELADIGHKSIFPGKMHACGHDAHVSMLLVAAKILSRHRDAFRGRVKFVFQPAEEGTPPGMAEQVRAAGYEGQGGAAFMVRQGVLEGVDACLVLHVQPALPVGTVSISGRNACASSDVFRIRIQGKGGHGAQPQNAIDPVPAMAELIGAIHMLPAREISAVETCVLSVGSVETPGSVWNAVAETACISGGIRAFNPQVREHLNLRVKQLAEGIAAANRCTVRHEREQGYMPCINDEQLAVRVADSCGQVLGSQNVALTDTPAMTSEDCGAYLSRVPGVFFWLGAGSDPSSPALHNPYFRVEPDALVPGARIHVNNVLSLLS